MTGVEFHFNAPDKGAYAFRLLRKAFAKGAKVVVTGEGAFLRELDRLLWTREALEFLPHGLVGAASSEVIEQSPIVLAESARAAPHHDVLVNLGSTVPDGFERFERLIEVVSQDEADRRIARQRWRHYADRGYSIRREDLELKQ